MATSPPISDGIAAARSAEMRGVIANLVVLNCETPDWFMRPNSVPSGASFSDATSLEIPMPDGTRETAEEFGQIREAIHLRGVRGSEVPA